MGILSNLLAPILEKGKEEFRIEKTIKGNGKIFYYPQWKYPSCDKWNYFYHGHPDSTSWGKRFFKTEKDTREFLGIFEAKTIEYIPYTGRS